MPKTILVVDDSATVRKFASISLTMQGFQIVTANDGMDALEKLPMESIDLVITDLNMPNMDGFEFIKSLRENPQYNELPIIILSSLSDEVNKTRGKELDVNAYLVKPFSLERIQYEVSKFLSWTDE
jgi:two-component system, chemotaxis family, chemotaxis protein CheY